MSRTGGCMCGAVRFEVTNAPTKTGACHCGMCRKQSGGIYLGVEVPGDAFKITQDEGMKIYTSSPWAERAFCGNCGSSLFYRVTAPGDHNGVCHVGLGSFNDSDGIELTEEIFIDLKPAGYAFANDTKKMTEAEVMAMFAPS